MFGQSVQENKKVSQDFGEEQDVSLKLQNPRSSKLCEKNLTMSSC